MLARSAACVSLRKFIDYATALLLSVLRTSWHLGLEQGYSITHQLHFNAALLLSVRRSSMMLGSWWTFDIACQRVLAFQRCFSARYESL